MLSKSKIVKLSAIVGLLLSSQGVFAQDSGCNMFRFSNGSPITDEEKVQHIGCELISGEVSVETEPTPEVEEADEFEEELEYSFFDNVTTGYWVNSSSSSTSCASSAIEDVTRYQTVACTSYLSDVYLPYPTNINSNTMPLVFDANDTVDITFHFGVESPNEPLKFRVGPLGIHHDGNGTYKTGVVDYAGSGASVAYGANIDHTQMEFIAFDSAPVYDPVLANLHETRVLYDNGYLSVWHDGVLMMDASPLVTFSSRNYQGVSLVLSDGGPIWMGPLHISIKRRADE